MRWHRNPFFHTAVLPPSVAPSVLTSTRPSADLNRATATAVGSAAVREKDHPSGRPSVDRLGRPSADHAPRLSFDPSCRPSVDHQPPGILAEAASRVAASQAGGSLRHLLRHRRPKVPKLTICEPSDRLTAYQAFYIFGLDGLGAFVLSGGINFAIGYAMYKTIDVAAKPIRLFEFPNTLAGDAAVTIFLQIIITWFIELLLVNRDLRSGHIQPIGFVPEPTQSLLRWFLLLDRNSPSASPDDDRVRPHDDRCRCCDHAAQRDGAASAERYTPGSWQHWTAFLVSQLLRALLLAVLSFVHRGSDWSFDDLHGAHHLSWAPPLFKLVFGGILALLTTPPFAAFWLVRCGWAVQANQRHLAAAGGV